MYRNAVRSFMRTIILMLLLVALAAAKDPKVSRSDCPPLHHSADLLYRPVVRAMWSQDEGKHSYATASGFIRIAVHPTWTSEFFADVQLNRDGAANIFLYSLPKDTKTVTVLIERELKLHPDADAESLAKLLPVRRQMLQADKKIDDLINEFFTLRLQPRRIAANIVRVDATEYELEYIGDDTILFNTEDYETPVVKWIESLLSAVHESAPR